MKHQPQDDAWFQEVFGSPPEVEYQSEPELGFDCIVDDEPEADSDSPPVEGAEGAVSLKADFGSDSHKAKLSESVRKALALKKAKQDGETCRQFAELTKVYTMEKLSKIDWPDSPDAIYGAWLKKRGLPYIFEKPPTRLLRELQWEIKLPRKKPHKEQPPKGSPPQEVTKKPRKVRKQRPKKQGPMPESYRLHPDKKKKKSAVKKKSAAKK
eukprot:gene3944-1027_t